PAVGGAVDAALQAGQSGQGAVQVQSQFDLKQASLHALRANPIMENNIASMQEPKLDEIKARAEAAKAAEKQDDPDLIPIKPTLSDEEVPNQPGAILKHAREMLGISQREIAMRLKLRVNSISDIENDRLNQPTAAAFARGHIANYARLVNIDPKVVVDLYDKNVQAVREQTAVNSKKRRRSNVVISNNTSRSSRNRRRRSGSGLKRVVYSLIFLGIAGGLLVNYFYTRPVEDNVGSEPLVIEGGSLSGELNAAGGSNAAAGAGAEGALSGELTGSLNAEAAAAAGTQQGQTPAAPSRSDLNTMRAQAQASALGTNDLTEEALPQSDEVDTTAPLITTAAPVRNAQPVRAEAETAPAQNTASQAAAHTAAGQSAQSSHPAQISAAPQASAPRSEEVRAQQTAAAANAPVQAAEPVREIVDNKSNSTEGSLTIKEPKPALVSNLHDVSSQVRVEGRDGLASLNSAVIIVRGEVFLRVTDQRGKVLASGNYSNGQSVSVTGIPPIKVEVTDSSRIQINYMGGRLVMPRARQVSFDLPQR
ncbi:MAG: DUF4115 domain-containing protein, partial [Proteobacteria bacterium]|nr:DUF4115 domain-containing protein [Candidatus Avisuccinivibrio stercorigallinarum]